MTTIRLTKRQYELMYSDCYCEYPEDSTVNRNEVATRELRNELRQGRIVTVSAALLSELTELADRDDSPSEQSLYRHLLSKGGH